MMLYLFKPFGGDNYLTLTTPEDIQKFFGALAPGDEFLMGVLEIPDNEYENLDTFSGFEGAPTSGGGGNVNSATSEDSETTDQDATDDTSGGV